MATPRWLRRRAAIQSTFWAEHVTRKAQLQFFAGVFLLFSIVGTLHEMAAVEPTSWRNVAIWTVWSGILSAGWAYGFTHDRRVLPIAFLASPLVPRFFGDAFWQRDQDPHRFVLYMATLGIVVLAYIMFIHFIATEGTRSMRMGAEMRLAKDIHESLVPPLTLSTARVETRGRSDPTTEVGGDLLDAVPGEHRDAVFVADVTGHGVPAGVLMAMVKSAIRVQLGAGVPLDRLVETVNRVLHESTQPSMFATFAAMQFEAGRAHVAIAGHPPIFRRHGLTGAVERLENEYPPLGILPALGFTARTIETHAGDLFLIFTDGLTEVRNGSGEEFGEERLERLFHQFAGGGLAAVERALLDAVREFGRQEDDQTLLLVRVL